MTEQNNEEQQQLPPAGSETTNAPAKYIPLPVIIGSLGAIILVPVLLMLVTASPNAGSPPSTPRPVSNTIVQPPPVTGNSSTGVGLGLGNPTGAVDKNAVMSKEEKQETKAERKATATAIAAARSARAATPIATPTDTRNQKNTNENANSGKNRDRAGKSADRDGLASPEAKKRAKSSGAVAP